MQRRSRIYISKRAIVTLAPFRCNSEKWGGFQRIYIHTKAGVGEWRREKVCFRFTISVRPPLQRERGEHKKCKQLAFEALADLTVCHAWCAPWTPPLRPNCLCDFWGRRNSYGLRIGSRLHLGKWEILLHFSFDTRRRDRVFKLSCTSATVSLCISLM
jgi:hypothetical protein